MPAWRSVNVLENTPGGKRLWQLAVEGGQFTVNKETALLANESAPSGAVGKDWQELFRGKLNIAWIPIEKVFVRAIQLPTSEPAEIQSMVELQLEKLSPLPVTHVVWSTSLVPKPPDKPDALQTVIVIIALRSFVEEYLGELEGMGFLPDRLECAALDELLATKINEDGVWLFPGEDGQPSLVAWQTGGILQNLTLLSLPAGPERGELLTSQLQQLAWAAELEGWLTAPPVVHLVAKPAEAVYWEPILREFTEHPVDIRPPVGHARLAAFGAERCIADGVSSNLLPKEFATRYHQQFVDGLWMRGVFVVVGIYLAGVLAYFGALYSLRLSLQKQQGNLNAVSKAFLESQKDKKEIEILKGRAELQYAALDTWKAVAESMPDTITLNSLYFKSGKLELSGSAATDDLEAIYAFNGGLRRATKNGKDDLLFTDVGTPKTVSHGDKTEWSFTSTARDTETP